MKRLFVFLACLTAGICHASPPDTVISYQGSLHSNGQPANGIYDFVFEVYPASSGGTALAASTNLLVGVTNGLFSTLMDFGAVFDAQPYWLAISVRASGNGAFTPLTGRQRASAVPKAVHAVNADTAQFALGAEMSTINTTALQDQSVTSVKIAEDTIVNADISASAAIADTKLATISTPGKVANSATSATISNVPNTIVARDDQGDISASVVFGTGLDVTGFLRSGSEAGTSEAPFLPEGGMIFRRLNSSETAAGSIVARTDSCTLVRDGTTAGLRVNYTASNEKLSFNAIGLSFYGTNVNFRATVISSSAGFVQLFSDAQRVVHAQISFGDVYGDGGAHVTHVTLDRFDSVGENDYYLTGTIISSYNQ